MNIEKLVHLEELDVSENLINSVEIDDPLEKLIILKIHKNPLINLDDFEMFPKLQELNISECDLEEEDELIKLKKNTLLRKLEFHKDETRSIQFAIENLKQLDFVNNTKVMQYSLPTLQKQKSKEIKIISKKNILKNFKSNQKKIAKVDFSDISDISNGSIDIKIQPGKSDVEEQQDESPLILEKKIAENENGDASSIDCKDPTEVVVVTEEIEIKKAYIQFISKLPAKKDKKSKELKMIGMKHKKYGEIIKLSHKSLIVRGDAFKDFFASYKNYLNIEELNLEYILIDNLILKENRQKLEKFKKLRTLTFKYNNIKKYLELINFENIPNLINLKVIHNQVAECGMLRYFIFYRYSKIEYFNDFEKTEEELDKTKDIYLDFDKILQKLHKINFSKRKSQGNDKQKISKKVAESFITSLKNRFFARKNFDDIFERVLDDCIDSLIK